MAEKSDDRLEDFLEHHGVKGMKWGRRKRDNSSNPNYTENQRKRDTQVYGARGEKRVNRALNEGATISVARGAEKTRRDRVMAKNKYYRQGGKVGGAVLGVVGGNVAATAAQRAVRTKFAGSVLRKVLGPDWGRVAQLSVNMLDNPVARVAISAGSAKVGSMLAGDSGVALNMRLHGYDPNRK